MKMKINNTILYLIGLILFSSCQDMFSPADENTRQEDAMYVESEYANGLLMYGYARLFQGSSAGVAPYMNTTTTDIATDDAVSNKTSNTFMSMAAGAWTADNDPMSQWNGCKDGIQYVNKFLTIVRHTDWARSADYKQMMFEDRLSGEAYAIRAILYYNLLMAHGGYAEDGILYGVPLLTEPEDASSNFNQERALFSACVKQIFVDCDSAMRFLPMDYNDIASNEEIPARYKELKAVFSGYNSVFGINSRNRISGRVAEAVKAQAALLAASPAFRDQSGVTSAEAAALCAEVLKHNNGMAGFDKAGHLDWWASSYKNFIDGTSPEVLWRSDRSKNNTQEREFFPPSIYGNGSVNPTQNLVDAFPMNNGLPITDPKSGYDPQNPYANRDMRLSNTVIYNGMKYKTANILTGEGMPYGQNNEILDNINAQQGYSTVTGYYLKKLLRDDVSANPSSRSEQNHIYPRIRYTEIYLAYAEAANDAWGPNSDPTGVGFTAYDVIKAIRERAGIGKDEFGRELPGGDLYIETVKNDKEKMTELIRNERRLELCFENKRFWDMRRWLLPLNETVKGMKIEKINPNDDKSPLRYTVFELGSERQHKFGTYQYYGPIPLAETLKWSNLKQNKDWQ